MSRVADSSSICPTLRVCKYYFGSVPFLVPMKTSVHFADASRSFCIWGYVWSGASHRFYVFNGSPIRSGNMGYERGFPESIVGNWVSVLAFRDEENTPCVGPNAVRLQGYQTVDEVLVLECSVTSFVRGPPRPCMHYFPPFPSPPTSSHFPPYPIPFPSTSSYPPPYLITSPPLISHPTPSHFYPPPTPFPPPRLRHRISPPVATAALPRPCLAPPCPRWH